jgi:hypothetical protein
VRFNPDEVIESASELASLQTSYYNISRQTFHQAMLANQVSLYIQFNDSSVEKLKSSHPKLIDAYLNKYQELT